MLENLLIQLEHNDPALKKLDLRGQTIKLETLQRIASALEKNTYLEIIDLGKNNIDAMGATILTNALEKNRSLKALSIDYNKIGDAGIKAFAKMLGINTSLTYLDVSANSIGMRKESTGALAEALITNSTLKVLKMNVNSIGDDGAQAMAKALEKNTSLEYLYLELNAISQVGEGALTTALEKNTSITILNLVSTILDPAGERHENCEHCDNRFAYLKRNQGLLKEEAHQDRDEDEFGSPGVDITVNPEKIIDLNPPSGVVETDVEMDFFIRPFKYLPSRKHVNGYTVLDFGLAGEEVGLKKPCVVLINSAISKSELETQIKTAILAKKPVVVYFPLTAEVTKEMAEQAAKEVIKEAKGNFFGYCDVGLKLSIAAVASELPFEAFVKKVSSWSRDLEALSIEESYITTNNNEAIIIKNGIDKPQIPSAHTNLPDEIIVPEKSNVNLTGNGGVEISKNEKPSTDALVEQNKNISVPKKEKSAKFPWGKLALFLILGGLGSVIGLAATGLFLSFWMIIPAAVLLIGIGIGIKVLYAEYQQRKSDQQVRLLSADGEDNKFTSSNEIKLLRSQKKVRQTTSTEPGKLFPEFIEISKDNVSNIKEMEKAEKAKKIIIQKLNELFFSSQTKKLTIEYQNTTFEFTPEEIQECFADMENKLAIVQKKGTDCYMLQWEINTSLNERQEFMKKQFNRVKGRMGEVFSSPSAMMGTFDGNRRQSTLVKIAIAYCIGEGIADKHPDGRHPNSIIISPSSIEKIIGEQPSKEVTQNIL